MKIIRIFISSPGDVAEERDKAEAVIRDLDRHYSGRAQLVAVRWENLGLGAQASFQEGIVKVLSAEGGVDIAVFIMWSRLGTPQGGCALRADGKPYRSGTEQEFDLMLEACRESGGLRPHILAYVRDDDRAYSATLAAAPVTEHSRIVEQRTLARQFISETFADAATGRNLRAFHTYDQPVTFADRLRVHLRDVLDRLTGDATVRWDQRPYRGLEVFDLAHEAIFRGREEQVCEVLHRLRQNAGDGCAFTVIVGASGSGKSSLARAGIVPSLLHHAHDGAKQWRHAVFTPSLASGAPLAGLAEVLAAPCALPELRRQVRDLSDLAQSLATDPAAALKLALLPALRDACEAAGGPVRLILVVDQMEEFFASRTVTAEERAAFLRALETFARHAEPPDGPPFRILATLRSDFYAAAQRGATFLRLKGRHGHCDLPPPDPAALHRIIAEPARLAGLEFEERDGVPLDRRLLAEAVRGADALPLLEYALDALYEQRDTTGPRPRLTHDAYEAMGGVEGALGGQAEKVFMSLPEDARAAFAAMMQELVTVDASPEAPPLRQRVPLAALMDTPAKETLVTALLEARFLTADADARTGAPVASLAHEALLRRWERLAVWIEANREHLRVRARVEQVQALWERDHPEPGRRDPSLLLPEGLPLEEARSLLRTSLPRAGTADYIRASIAHHEAATAHRRRLRRNVVTALSMLLVAALVAAGWAIAKQRQATEALVVANREKQRATDEAARAEREKTAANEAKNEADTLTAKQEKQLESASWAAFNQAQRLFDEADKADLTKAGGEATRRSKTREALLHLARAVRFNPANGAARGLFGWQVVLRRDALGRHPEATLPHGAVVIAASFSPDGSRLVTASSDKSAKVWDAATGKAIATLPHDAEVRVASFSPDGSRVVTASRDKSAKVWDAATGKAIATLPHDATVWNASFSPDGSRVVTASWDKTAKVWEVATGKAIATLPHDAEVNAASFSPDGSRVVTASGDYGKPGVAKVWDAATGKAIATLPHDATVWNASFSPDGSRVATASDDKSAKVWDAATGKAIVTLPHDDVVWSASFSPDGSRVVTASTDKSAKVWDAATGKAVATLPHYAEVNAASFSPDGSRMVTASGDYGKPGVAKVWDAATGKAIATLPHYDAVYAASFSPDGSRLVTASADKSAKVWDAATSKVIATLLHDNAVYDASFSPDGSLLVTASWDKTAKVWEVATGKAIATLPHDATVWNASFSPDGSRVATASDDKSAKVWDAATGKAIATLPHGAVVYAASFSPDGSRVVTGSADKGAKVWDAATGKAIATLRHDDSVRAASFSPDGSRVVTASWDKTAKVWDAATGKAIATLPHDAKVNAASFSPDGSRVVTASGDFEKPEPGVAKVWDAATGKAIATLPHDAKVNAASFSPDGSRVVTASGDFEKPEPGVAKVWDAATSKAIGGAERVADLYETIAESLSGQRLSENGDLRPLNNAERAEIDARLAKLAAAPGPEGKLARWLAATGPDAPATPMGTITRRERVEALLANGTAIEVREANSMWPAHPLMQIALAAHERAPKVADQPEGERKAAMDAEAGRAAFLRDYGLRRLPDDPTLWGKAAAMLAPQKDFPRALKAADKALALDAKNLPALRARATSLNVLKRDDEALAAYRTLVETGGDKLEDFTASAYLAAKLGRRADAEFFLAGAHEKFSDSPGLAITEGWSRVNLGDAAAALAAFRRAEPLLTAGEEPPEDLLCGLGLALWLDNQQTEAVATYRKLIETKLDWAKPETISGPMWPEAEAKPLEALRAATLKRHPWLQPKE